MEFTTNSGVKVKIGMGDFEDVLDLQAAIMKEISGADFSLDGLNMDEDVDISRFIKVGMSVLSSKEVRSLLFKCLARCTYDGQRITAATFQDETARADFYEVSFVCLKENLIPFFASLLSKYKPHVERFLPKEKSQKSK